MASATRRIVIFTLLVSTFKKALFKSNPNNVGTGIRDYRVDDVTALAAGASLPSDETRLYHYFSCPLGSTWVSVALSFPVGRS